MKKTPFALLLCLFLLSSLNSLAQNPDELVKKFFNEYETEGATVSLDNLYETNPWVNRNADAIKNLKTQLNGMNEDLVGKLRGRELIVRKTLGESFVLMSYMVKFDRHPIRFTFEFYKPKDKWILFAFLFDDNLDDELEEAAKIHMLKKLNDN